MYICNIVIYSLLHSLISDFQVSSINIVPFKIKLISDAIKTHLNCLH